MVNKQKKSMVTRMGLNSLALNHRRRFILFFVLVWSCGFAQSSSDVLALNQEHYKSAIAFLGKIEETTEYESYVGGEYMLSFSGDEIFSDSSNVSVVYFFIQGSHTKVYLALIDGGYVDFFYDYSRMGMFIKALGISRQHNMGDEAIARMLSSLVDFESFKESEEQFEEVVEVQGD
jgi:hypothetical protein